MKNKTKILLLIALFLIIGKSIAQTAISDVTGYIPNPKAVLDINSTTKGLLLPRLTTAQRVAIAPTATQTGLTVFDITTKSQWFFDGMVWKEMAGGFSLPYSGINNDGNNALDINNTVGRAAYFQSPNSLETMRVYNSGTGNAITVDGNLNVTGDLKANGTTGTAGQVLQNNGNGTIGWVNKGDYANFKAFYAYVLNSPWTVPANVKKIMVEAWGGGGGGNQFGGGGGASYLAAIINVSPGDLLTVGVGTGGDGAALTAATNGIYSTFSINGVTANVRGGYAATAGTPGPLDGQSPATSFTNSFGIRGSGGKINNYSYGQTSSTNFVKIINYGDGGDAGNAPGSGGKGGIKITNSVNTAEDLISAVSPGINYGGGGGGGILGNGLGGAGSDGIIIVRW